MEAITFSNLDVIIVERKEEKYYLKITIKFRGQSSPARENDADKYLESFQISYYLFY